MAIGEGAHMVLYRGDAVGDGEETITADSASAAQKVEFDQVGIGMFDWGHSLERFRPSVPDPNAESPRKPDTGLSALKVMVHAVAHRHDVGAQPGTQDGPAARLKRWAARPQVVPDTYDEGRFGLWFWQDMVISSPPQRNAGFKLNSVKTTGIPQHPSRQVLEIELEWSGKISLHVGLGAALS